MDQTELDKEGDFIIPSFDEIMQKLTPELEALEELRLEHVKDADRAIIRYNPWYFIPVIIGVCLWRAPENIMMALFICFGVWAFSAFKPNQKYYKQFVELYKSSIVKPFIQMLIPQSEYYPDYEISKAVFQQCGLFTSPDRYHSEDLIDGRIGKTNIRFAEVYAQREVKKDEGSPTYKTIFNGIFFYADFNKDFVTEVVVKSKGNRRTYSDQNYLFLEDPVFNSYFDTYYTDDPLEARYILTPSLMERILRLEQKTGGLQFAFNKSRVFIAIPDSNNYFEGRLKSTIMNEERLRKEYELIVFVTGLVDELNLNLRIWSKQ